MTSAASFVIFAAGDGGAHAHDGVDVVGRHGPRADALGRVLEADRRVADRQRVLGPVAPLDRVLVGVDLAEVVGHAREVGDVLHGRRAVLVGARVEHHDAGAEVGEADAAALEHDVVLGHPPAEAHAARRRADRVFDDVRRDLDDLGLAVDPAAAVGHDVEGLVALDEHAGALEHLEGAAVQVVDVGVAEDLEAQAGAAPHPGLEVAFHWRAPLARDPQGGRLPLRAVGRHPSRRRRAGPTRRAARRRTARAAPAPPARTRRPRAAAGRRSASRQGARAG